jgi:hypothetical protein
MMTTMQTPERSCIGCRTKGGKKRFLRVCRRPDGTLSFDPTGKAPGRGAYLCADAACIRRALNTKSLTRAFRLTTPVLPTEIQILEQALLRHIASSNHDQ